MGEPEDGHRRGQRHVLEREREVDAQQERDDQRGVDGPRGPDGDRPERLAGPSRVLFDRFDDAQANAHLADEGGEADESAPGSVGDRSQRAGSTFLEELTDGETDEDDIGGYYRDIRFIFDAITSGAFYIVGVFMVVLASTFAWLYTGGIGDVYAGFLRRVPNEVLKPGQTAGEAAKVIALHPVEALVFEVKFSALVAGLVVLPMI
ncbi:MAG: hypothetical protein V5A85_06975, partial [Haloarculaceae archaeon]